MDPRKISLSALAAAKIKPSAIVPYNFPVKPPELAPGVVPKGAKAPVMAMDDVCYTYGAINYQYAGFPGYPYLAQLTTRPEYRAMASALATETTRKWIEFTTKSDDKTAAAEKLKAIEAEFIKLNVRGIIATAVTQDAFFGRAQIFIDLRGADVKAPLVLDKRTVALGSLIRIAAVEATWTTPNAYNAENPARADFYVPTGWFMLGEEVHATRLLTIITRPLPDILKPAFNFGGMSLSQLAQPYVDNWIRTRQSVSDLIGNFSITCLATTMDQVLQGGEGEDADGTNLFRRADLFNATRDNRGLMLLDKNNEEIVQVNTPLSGLHELQAQSQEQMCAVSRTPAIVLTGISPGGLNASSDSEIRVFYDWINAQQEAYWRAPLEIILKVVQLSLFGEIDHDIGFTFVPLFQMSPAEEAEIRSKDATTAATLIGANVLDPAEERKRLAHDPLSGYNGIDIAVVPAAPLDDTPDELGADGEFREGDHPRAANGEFGSGGGGKVNFKYAAGKRSDNLKTAKAALESNGHSVDIQYFPGGEIARTLGTGKGAKIILNSGSDYWFNPANESKKSHTLGLTSSPNKFHALHHEAAHVAGAYPNDTRDFADGEKAIAAKVSKYAASNRNEFLAEYSAATIAGVKYDDEITALYNKLMSELPRNVS